MPSIFTKIIKGEIPCYKIEENEHCIAFLDINPLKKGHTLVIPKQEIDYIFDLEENTLNELMLFSKKVAKAIEQVVPCKRIGLSVVGLEVPHAHIHLIPINGINDMNFDNKRLPLTAEDFERIAKNIREKISS